MSFQVPQALYFFLPLAILVVVLGLYARSRRRRAAAAFVDAAMARRILPEESAARFWIKIALWEFGILFSLLALARPQWGEVVEEIKVKGSDLYVLIDVSRSMLCADVPPTRLDRAKADVSGLLNKLKGERIGLIAFAGRAALKCPLTVDYPFFRAALNELGPNSVDRGGTAIGDAIRTALNVLPEAPDRDQAILLITDGDDQDSDPLHAAAIAAERHVTIFTVGLGDPNEGAKVPDKAGDGKAMQYDGKDVVSKMGDDILKQIALQAKGEYIPARTKPYDLGQLYAENLSKLRGEYATQEKRRRMGERFEFPLALALICFTLEMLIRPYRQKSDAAVKAEEGGVAMKASSTKPKVAAASAVLLLICAFNASAGDARDLANQGLSLYAKKDFAAAGDKFNEAEQAVPKEDWEVAARAAFDAGCAFQQKGDAEKAKEAYLKAVAARDKSVSSAAQFNLGELEAAGAKEMAGAQPENVAPEKRKELVDKLLAAVSRYRSCLEIKPDHADARKNIELIRQWLKLYANKWAEIDRNKRRAEMNLFQFVEYLSQTERGLRVASRGAGEYASADDCAELKRVQDELAEEIEPLKDKIREALAGAQPQGGAAAKNPDDDKQKAQALKVLNGWADESGDKMRAASAKLNETHAQDAAPLQKESADSLDKIWEALAPFGLNLSRDMKEESLVVNVLKPEDADEKDDKDSKEAKKDAKKEEPAKKPNAATPAPELSKDEFSDLAELQADVSRRTAELKVKAEMEIKEMEKNTPAATAPAPQQPGKPKEEEKDKKWLTLDDVKREEAKKKLEEEAKKQQQDEAKKRLDEQAKTAPLGVGDKAKDEKKDAPPTPEEIKAGLKKAVELAPKAVEKMESAAAHLKKQERTGAAADAEEAKRILQEIIDAQPKPKKDEKKDEKKDDEKKKEDEKKQDEQDKKKDQDKKDEKDKDKDKKGENAAPQQMSKEMAEAMLRKVRERELDHKKKKQEEQAAILGRLPGVEKDW